MPVVTIQAVPPAAADVDALLAAVVAAAATALGREPESVWARFVAVAARAGSRAETSSSQHPVVRVETREQPRAVVERTLDAIVKVVSAHLGVKASEVWARWDTLEPGTIYADGGLT